jgi:hypothetical protein
VSIFRRKPSAREYFLTNVVPRHCKRTYEEYVLETSIAKGRMKKPLGGSLLQYYRDHPLASLRHSNSIELDYACRAILDIAPNLGSFLSRCFVGVTVDTDVNASAFYASPEYDGRIIRVDPGLSNWLEFLIAPLVTLSWAIDSETPVSTQPELPSLLESQIKALQYLRTHNTVHSEINVLELPGFPLEEMYLERTYYKQAALAFVLLHEIAHHVLAHTDDAHLPLVNADVRHYTSSITSPQHAIEFEADYFAARTLAAWVARPEHAGAESANDAMINGYLIGPLLTFIGFCYLSDTFCVDADSHPSTFHRLRTYIAFYRSNFAEFNTDYGLFVTRLFSEMLWGENSSILAAWD